VVRRESFLSKIEHITWNLIIPEAQGYFHEKATGQELFYLQINSFCSVQQVSTIMRPSALFFGAAISSGAF